MITIETQYTRFNLNYYTGKMGLWLVSTPTYHHRVRTLITT